MGEAKRRQLAGNTNITSTGKWKRKKKFTRKMERELQEKVFRRLLGRLYSNYSRGV